MEHISFVLRIDPADEEKYRKRHESVDPELEAQFGKVGIHRYHIFYHEGTLFAYMMVDDFEEAMKKLADQPANVKWQSFMSDLLLEWEHGGTVKRIEEVYSYEKSVWI